MGWHDIPIADVAEKLQTNTACGLDAAQVRRRIRKFGPNTELPTERSSFWKLLWGQVIGFEGIIALAAAVCAAVACAAGQLRVASAVGVVLLAVIRLVAGIVPAASARRKSARLAAESVMQATFLRERAAVRASSASAVPGDIIVIRAGDEICADARLIECDRLGCDESQVFGTAQTQYKNPYASPDALVLPEGQNNMVFAGSFAVCGRGRAIVVATGADTCAARQRRTTLAPPAAPTRTQKELDALRLRFYGSICVISTAAGVIFGMNGEGIFASVTAALATAAAAVTLFGLFDADRALGEAADRLIGEGVTFKKSDWVEKCSDVSVIFTDIFDLYTEGELSVGEFWTPFDGGEQTELERVEQQNTLLKTAAVALGNPDRDWQKAVFEALSVRQPPQSVLELFRREFEFSFGSGATAVVQAEGKLAFAMTCAEWKELAPRCRAGEEVYQAAQAMERRGLRVYAAAIKRLPILPVVAVREEIECDMRVIGLMGLSDSLKPSVRALMSSYEQAGVKPVVISSASHEMVCAYALKMGLADNEEKIVSGERLNNMSHAELEEELENISVYSELDERAKQRVIKAWKNTGHTVAAELTSAGSASLLRLADVGFSDDSCGMSRAAARAVVAERGSGAPLAAVKRARGARAGLSRRLTAATACGVGCALSALVTACFGRSGIEPSVLMLIMLFAQGIMLCCLPCGGSDGELPSGSLLPREYGIRGLLQCVYIIAATVLAGLIGLASGAVQADTVITFALAQYMSVVCAASENVIPGRGSKKLWLSLFAALALTASAVIILIGCNADGWGGLTSQEILLCAVLGVAALPIGTIIKLFTKRRPARQEAETEAE